MEDLPSPRRRTTTSGSLTWADARGASPGYPKTATLAPPSDLESRSNRDPTDLARRCRPPATTTGLLDLWPRRRADALSRRRSPSTGLGAAPDAPDS